MLIPQKTSRHYDQQRLNYPADKEGGLEKVQPGQRSLRQDLTRSILSSSLRRAWLETVMDNNYFKIAFLRIINRPLRKATGLEP